MIFSAENNNTTFGTNWTSITAGSLALTIGSTTNILSGLDFSMAGSLDGVAVILQDAINDQSGAMWVNAIVKFAGNGAGQGGFVFTGGISTASTADSTISVAIGGGGTDITKIGLLGWVPGNIRY